MKGSDYKDVHKALRWLTVAITMFVVPSLGRGQGTIIYSDIWTSAAGGGTFTAWATGVTDDYVHGVQHNAYVETTFQGPSGYRYQSAGWIDGYNSTVVNLPATEGTYSVSSTHQTACGGFLGTSSALRIFAVTYSVKTSNYTDASGYCSQGSNCNPYVIPKCSVTQIKEAFGPGVFCHNFHVTLTPVVNGTCTVGVSQEVAGPGPCTPQ